MKCKQLMLLVMATLLSGVCFAGGGLQAGTDALTTIKTWLFGFVGIAALVYLLYNVLMALMERKQWSEVGLALVYCTLAGGAVIGGTWALTLFQ